MIKNEACYIIIRSEMNDLGEKKEAHLIVPLILWMLLKHVVFSVLCQIYDS